MAALWRDPFVPRSPAPLVTSSTRRSDRTRSGTAFLLIAVRAFFVSTLRFPLTVLLLRLPLSSCTTFSWNPITGSAAEGCLRPVQAAGANFGGSDRKDATGRETEAEMRAINAKSWKPMPRMVKRQTTLHERLPRLGSQSAAQARLPTIDCRLGVIRRRLRSAESAGSVMRALEMPDGRSRAPQPYR